MTTERNAFGQKLSSTDISTAETPKNSLVNLPFNVVARIHAREITTLPGVRPHEIRNFRFTQTNSL